MSDFYQHDLISTLHRLNGGGEHLEKELEKISRSRSIALVLPSLYSELEGPALRGIVRELSRIGYLGEVVISMNRMDRRQFQRALKFFKLLEQPHRIIWNDGTRMNRLYARLQEQGLARYVSGKGFNVWLAFGYLLAGRKADVIVTHDCDIVNYDRNFLARLAYPVASASLSYEYCKAYYARVTDRMYGRVTRLFVTPLIRSLIQILGHHPLLVYLDNFRYPLAGEFALSADLATAIRIPGDWGLEIEILAEVYRNTAARRICQIELAESFEHKHQELARGGTPEGLMKMAFDIARSLFRTLASEGLTFDPATFTSLKFAYVRVAREMLQRYQHDARVNGLVFDARDEGLAIETFVDAIELAAKTFLKDRLVVTLIPSWSRVESAMPGFLDELREQVDKDNAL